MKYGVVCEMFVGNEFQNGTVVMDDLSKDLATRVVGMLTYETEHPESGYGKYKLACIDEELANKLAKVSQEEYEFRMKVRSKCDAQFIYCVYGYHN